MQIDLIEHQKKLKQCTMCPQMAGAPVHGNAVMSSVLLIGQAPGIKEAELDRPFAWTAGKTLFKWFNQIGIDEQGFRQQVYMTAVCRCFPGKGKNSGDRVPDKQEIANCHQWLAAEINIIQPQLILLVGKLAISQVMPVNKLADIIGTQVRAEIAGHSCDFIPLPHPSGASTWFRTEPGVSLLHQAMQLIEKHPAWQKIKN